MSIRLRIDTNLSSGSLTIEEVLPAAGVTAFFGPSGAGKTTLLRFMAGLFVPGSGRFDLNGDTLFDSESGINTMPELRGLGYVSQHPTLFPHLSVGENLLYGWHRSDKRGVSPEEVHECLGLGSLLDRNPSRLSGGERQRVAIGRALLRNPRLLLLDEPMAGLDGPRRDRILDYLETVKFRWSTPTILVTHDIDDVTRLADHLVLLDSGRVVRSGDVYTLTSDVALLEYTGRFAAGAVIETVVSGHNQSLTELSFDGGLLKVPRLEGEAGRTVRVRILARDVMVALEPLDGISANNVLAATVVALTSRDDQHVHVQLDLNGTRLLALITSDSTERLGLEAGRRVYAVIKSVRADPGASRRLTENG